MSERTAACSCGALRLVAAGEPARVSICHCLACQARTGSVFGVQARFPRERVRVAGDDRVYARTGDDGGRVEFHFCPACGATVWYAVDSEPWIAVPVGAFAAPDFPAPTVSVYEERMHRWVRLPPGLDHIA